MFLKVDKNSEINYVKLFKSSKMYLSRYYVNDFVYCRQHPSVMQQTYIQKCILNCIINMSRNPNLSRTHDIEASFSPFLKGNPNLSRGLN